MWIQVRTIDGKETRTVEDLSRLTKIESLRLKIQDIFNVSPQQQRLFYRGKQVKANLALCQPPVKRWNYLEKNLVAVFGAVCSGPLVVFGPRRASCIRLHVLRNSPGVHGVPAPQKKRHYYVITRPRYAAMLHCLCLGEESRMQQMSGRRRHVCLHCRATEITIGCICIDVHLRQHGEQCTS